MLITSSQNPKFKLALSLDKKKTRREHKLISVEGLKENQHAIKGGFKPESFFVPENPDSDVADFLEKQWDGECFHLTEALFTKLAVREMAGKIVGLYREKTWSLDDIKLDKNSIILVADGVEKPGNLGAMLRSCDAFGVEAVLVTGQGVDMFSPNVVRASIGAVFMRPVIETSYEEVVSYCKKSGMALYFSRLDEKASSSVGALKAPCALVLGSEDRGISTQWDSLDYGKNIQIPMQGEVDSLNVSTATAILLYEIRR